MDAAQVDKVVAVARDHGQIDILVNAVGSSTVIVNPQATTEQVYQMARARGLNKQDGAAIVKVFEQMAGVTVKKGTGQ